MTPLLLLGIIHLTRLQFADANRTLGEEDAITPTPALSSKIYLISTSSAPYTEELNLSSALLTSVQTSEVFERNSVPLFSDLSTNKINTSQTYLNHSLQPTQTFSEEFATNSFYPAFSIDDEEDNFPNMSVSPKDFVFLSPDNAKNVSDWLHSSFALSSDQSTSVAVTPTSTSYGDRTAFPSDSSRYLSSSSHIPELDLNMTEEWNATGLQFLMIFHGNCTAKDETPKIQFNDFGNTVANVVKVKYETDLSVEESNVCHREVVEIPIVIRISEDIEDIFKRLKGLISKLNITTELNNETQTLTLVGVKVLSSCDDTNGRRGRSSFLLDFLPYIIIGAVFGGILLIAFILICSKCFCNCKKKKKPKRPDFEVPHLSLRPEDYILTRIPRPTTIYSDNMATPIIHDDASLSSGQPCYNGNKPYRQSFETSVVPMEDVMMTDDPYLRYKMHEYHEDDNGGELRTFNGKRLHHRSTETDDAFMYRNSQLVGSTEKLHRSSRDAHAFDNQAYVKI